MRDKLERRRREGEFEMVLLVESFEEGVRKPRDIPQALSERRQDDWYHIDAIIKVGPEIPVYNSRLKIPVGGAYESHVHLQRLGAANTLQFAFLQDA